MTFTEAIETVFRDNSRITRASWGKESVYVLLVDGVLSLQKDDGELPHQWIISESDFFGRDWEVVE